MGKQVPSGQQVHALPSLPWWAQSHHIPVSWVGPGLGLGGAVSGNVQAKQVPGRWVRPDQTMAGQAWGQGLGLWGVPEHGGRPLLTPSHPAPARSLGGGMFPGPDLLAALFLSSSCTQRGTLESYFYSFRTTIIYARYILVLLWGTQSSLISVLRILWFPVFLEYVLPFIYKREKCHVWPACPTIANTHQSRNSVIVWHALLSHLGFCVRKLSN